jgi:hypothetical protein
MTDQTNIDLAAALTGALVIGQGKSTVEEVIATCEAESARLRAEASERINLANGYDKIASGLRTVRGDAGTEDSSGSPSMPPGREHGRTMSTPERPAGLEAVRRIMRENPDELFTTRKLEAELERRGWEFSNAQDPHRAAEAALGRLWSKKGEIERVSRGNYRWKGIPQDGEPTSRPDAFVPHPRGRAAIRTVILEDPRTDPWDADAAIEAFKARGWELSRETVYNGLALMAREGELERVGKGRYVPTDALKVPE